MSSPAIRLRPNIDTGGEIVQQEVILRVGGKTPLMHSGVGASTMHPYSSNSSTRSAVPSRRDA